MNIFITDECPKKSAEYLDDKRVIKMVLESAQMLCTAKNTVDGNSPYKPTHANHPCNVWARQSQANYNWLFEHFIALSEEYTKRYSKIHKSSQLESALKDVGTRLPNIGLTPFANCAANSSLNVSYKNITDTYMAYRLYLADRWKTDKRKPTWFGISK